MEAAPDRLRFVLGQAVLTPPSKNWTYSGGAVALIGTLIARGTGLTLPEFARASLFAPLVIETFEWFAGKDGIPSAAFRLKMRPRDVLAIGQLVLNGGQWQGRQVVDPAWMSVATRRRSRPEMVSNTGGCGSLVKPPRLPCRGREGGSQASAMVGSGCG